MRFSETVNFNACTLVSPKLTLGVEFFVGLATAVRFGFHRHQRLALDHEVQIQNIE
jgi:hypothetical protein